ncbi:MAG: phosphoribosylformylglycinamidine cyclo-ligase [Actinomycetota bacterium]|nr:phosphoribosylformylglycinamidine cyclo-ligase [Actinomycetota bacterium]
MASDDPLSYAAAGVDLAAADAAVERLGPLLDNARRPEVLGGIGGFAGLFALDARRWREPVLASSADGVGTKVELARQLDVLETVGQDLVAMVADDLVVTGAEPLFLLDYLAVGRLDPDRVERIVAGVAEGCRVAGCALVGGETAEHPGSMDDDAFDLSGFGVGIVERADLLGPHRVEVGDALIAMAASGLHANGYSLVRRAVADVDLSASHGLPRALGQELLTPTRIYARDCLALAAALPVRTFCHITGGGLAGNLARILPEGLGARIDTSTWERPAVFGVVQRLGRIPDQEMWATFNQGIGMVAVVAPSAANDAVNLLAGRGVPAWVVGQVRPAGGIAIT